MLRLEWGYAITCCNHVLLNYFNPINCYRIFWTDFNTYIATPAKRIVCYNHPIITDFSFHPLFWIGDKDCCRTVFKAFSTIKRANTFFLIYPNAHRALWNIQLSQVLHVTTAPPPPALRSVASILSHLDHRQIDIGHILRTFSCQRLLFPDMVNRL